MLRCRTAPRDTTRLALQRSHASPRPRKARRIAGGLDAARGRLSTAPGSGWCPVVPAVFKTVVGLRCSPGWVRLPRTLANKPDSAGRFCRPREPADAGHQIADKLWSGSFSRSVEAAA